jgi:Family of unknown function (DUF5924)/Protein of unknown function (DUF2914)
LTEVALEGRLLRDRLSGVLGFGRRWAVSIVSFVGGCLTLLVFRRGLPHVGWIIGYLMLLWLLFVLVTVLRRPPADEHATPATAADSGTAGGPPWHGYLARHRQLMIAATHYTIQSLYHGLLLFVLPAYYASATLGSVNTVFVLMLLVIAVLTTVDPWYRAIVGPRPWLGHAVFGVSTFAALGVALPLIGVRPYPALLVSAGFSVLALAPAVLRQRGWPWRSALSVSLLLALVAIASVDLLRAWIPPAPLMLARSTLAWSVSGLEPEGLLGSHVRASDLREAGSIVAYTAIYAPPALSQSIVHVWRHQGDVVGVVPLSPVRGGRSGGFRTFSRKTAPADPSGHWSVEVLIPSGQLVGRLSFTVTE